jgi:hypothetical protein
MERRVHHQTELEAEEAEALLEVMPQIEHQETEQQIQLQELQ